SAPPARGVDVAQVETFLGDLYHVDGAAGVTPHDLVAPAQRHTHVEVGCCLDGRRASRGPSPEQSHEAPPPRPVPPSLPPTGTLREAWKPGAGDVTMGRGAGASPPQSQRDAAL